ncbi:MAG: aldolase/citrate lyase family protein [Casimicrobiaceae bacterium]
MTRTLAQLLQGANRIAGTWVQIAHPDIIDALGHAEFDFAIIDCEHGAFGIATAETLIRSCEAAGITALVRIPRGDVIAIGKALDAGAAGVLAPGVDTAQEAQRLVAATRFAPRGTRGACPIVRSAAHSAMPWREFAAMQDACGLIVMIETPAGVDDCVAICATEGVKAVLIGPFDLAVAMGHEGNHRHPAVDAAVRRVIEAARAEALPVFMPVFAPAPATLADEIEQWSALGVRCFAIGADKIMLLHAMQQYRHVVEASG